MVILSLRWKSLFHNSCLTMANNTMFVSPQQQQRNFAPAYEHAPATANQRSPRFFYWLGYFCFSLIVAGASIEASDRVLDSQRAITNQKWSVACSFVSFALALIVVGLHLSPSLSLFIVNTKLEGLMCIVMCCLWSAMVAVISDSYNGLAVDGDGAVVFGNLYYFGWGGFICSILLLFNYLKNVHYIELNEELRLRSDRLNLWIANFICAIVLMSSAANVFDHECHSTDRYGTKFCNRTLLALTDGASGCAFSLIMIGMKVATGMAPWGIEMLVSSFLFLVNCFSMGLVTAEEGPGAKIGNLFYFSWLNLIIPFMLLSATYEWVARGYDEAKKELEVFEQQGPVEPTPLSPANYPVKHTVQPLPQQPYGQHPPPTLEKNLADHQRASFNTYQTQVSDASTQNVPYYDSHPPQQQYDGTSARSSSQDWRRESASTHYTSDDRTQDSGAHDRSVAADIYYAPSKKAAGYDEQSFRSYDDESVLSKGGYGGEKKAAGYDEASYRSYDDESILKGGSKKAAAGYDSASYRSYDDESVRKGGDAASYYSQSGVGYDKASFRSSNSYDDQQSFRKPYAEESYRSRSHAGDASVYSEDQSYVDFKKGGDSFRGSLV